MRQEPSNYSTTGSEDDRWFRHANRADCRTGVADSTTAE